jgi:hypothetical protein
MFCSFHTYSPPAGSIPDGIYGEVEYTIHSKTPGQSQSGTKLLGFETIRALYNSTSRAKVKSKTIDHTSRRLIVTFVPSWISKMPVNSAAGFAVGISNNPVITGGDEYAEICGVPGGLMPPSAVPFFPDNLKYRAVVESLEFIHGTGYRLHVKPNVDVFTYKINTCANNSHCPVSSSDFELSRGCLTGGELDPVCSVSYDNFRTVPGEWYVPHSPSGTPPPAILCSEREYETSDPYAGQRLGAWASQCSLVRDFWYFRKDMKITIEESHGLKLFVTNSEPGSYTPSSTCPQSFEIFTH